jgi:hypothetical protein
MEWTLNGGTPGERANGVCRGAHMGHGLAVAEWVHHGGICPVSYNYTSIRNTVLKVLKHHSWRTDFGKIYFPEEEGAYRLRRGKY